MKYKCKTCRLSKMETTYKGFIRPLCETCRTIDCTNPIEKKKVSILGINKELRVYSRGNQMSFVVACEGYLAVN